MPMTQRNTKNWIFTRTRWGSMIMLSALGLVLPAVGLASTFHVGSVSAEPAAEIKKFAPFVSYLASQLKSEGIEQGKVVVAKNIPQIASLLRDGKVDLYIDSAFPAIAVSRLSGSKILLRRWKKGMGEYHSVIFARNDSGLDTLDDLKGRMIAFEEPFSTSGYFMPKLAFTEKGLRLVAKTDASDPVARGEVGYTFSLDDETTMLWVLRKKVSGGAMDNQSYLAGARKNPDSLKVLQKTFPLPRQLVTYRAGLAPALVARIKEVLMQLDKSEEGKKVLQNFERTAKFDEIPDQSLTPLLNAEKLIAAEFANK